MRFFWKILIFCQPILSMRGCNYVLNDSEGIIESPNFPSDYPSNSRCQWTIRAPSEHLIVLTFLEFALEDHRECKYDYVIVFDSPGIDEEKVRSYHCGTLPRFSITSAMNSVTIYFRSDRFTEEKGFKILYNRIPEVCTYFLGGENGTLASPLFDGQYANDRLCRYIIKFPKGKVLQLNFLDFDLQDPDNNGRCLDYVQISGFNNKSQVSSQYCGSRLPHSSSFYSGEITLLFVTDGTTTKTGFYAEYTVIEADECLDTINGTEYRGLKNVSADGYNCLPWSSLPIPTNSTLIYEENYCRTFGTTHIPSCFINNTNGNVQLRACDVPICGATTIESTVTTDITTETTVIMTTGILALVNPKEEIKMGWSDRFYLHKITLPTYYTTPRNNRTSSEIYKIIANKSISNLDDAIKIPVATLTTLLIVVLAGAVIIMCRKLYNRRLKTKPDKRIVGVVNPHYIATQDISNGYMVSYENVEITRQTETAVRESIRRKRKSRVASGIKDNKNVDPNRTGDFGGENNGNTGAILRPNRSGSDVNNTVGRDYGEGEERYSTILDLYPNGIQPEAETPYADKDELYDMLRRKRTRRRKVSDVGDYGSIVKEDGIYDHTTSHERMSAVVLDTNNAEAEVIYDNDDAVYQNTLVTGNSVSDINIDVNDRVHLVT